MTRRVLGLFITLMSLSSACSSSPLCESNDQCDSSQQCNSVGICEDKWLNQQNEPNTSGELIIAGDDAPRGGEMVTAGETTAGETTAGETTAGEATAGETTAGEATAGETTAGETTAGETTAGETTAGEITAGETTADEITAGEAMQTLLPCEATLCLESIYITDDQNGDGVMSPGESAVLNYFSMKNHGEVDINGLTGVISSDSPYLTFKTNRLSFTPGSSHQYVDADENRDNSDRRCPADNDCGQATSIRFELSLDTPINEVVIIQFDLTDELDHEYHLEYALPVVAHDVNLELVELIISRDSNHDGRLSPSESARISYFKMKNTGASNILDLTGVISSDSPYLSFQTERLRFTPGSSHYFSSVSDNDDNGDGECPAGGDCGQATSIRFEINPNAPIGAMIRLKFDLTDLFGHHYHLEYRLFVEDVDIRLEFVDAVITGDRNGDGVLSPNETAVLNYFTMRNFGTSDVVGLQGLISSQNPHLRFNSDRLSFTPGSVHYFSSAEDNGDNSDGECPSNGDCGQATAIRFEIMPNAPIGEQLIIEFDLFDRLDNEYHFEYPLLIEAVDVNLTLFEVIITGTQTIDGLSPGESATLNYFSLRNTGSADATGLSGVISSDSQDLTFSSERLVFTPGSSHTYLSENNNQDNSDGLCPSSNDCGQATNIRFNISEGALPGQVINLLFNLTDELENSYELSYPIEVQ